MSEKEILDKIEKSAAQEKIPEIIMDPRLKLRRNCDGK